MKTILVTGAPGFVGANLTRRLLEDGHLVHALVRPDQDLWRLEDVRDDLRLTECSLSDRDSLARVIKRLNPEWVFHLAAHGAYPVQTDYQRMVETNVLGTMNLVETCVASGFEAFVNSGSSSEYGFKDHPAEETELPEPNSHYAITKVAATLYCHYAAIQNDAHIVTLRLYSVYGPYEEPSRLWPTLILHALTGRLPPLTKPETGRDFVYVDDVLDAYLRAASAATLERGAVLNVGTGSQTSLEQLVEIVRRELELDAEPSWGALDNRAWDTSVWVADTRRIEQRLGWKARHTIEMGLRSFVAWFRKHDLLRHYYRKRIGLQL